MDIKEIALKVADSLRNKVDGISQMQSNQGLARFAEALFESYKAELLKEVGEPVAYMCSDEELCRKGYERFSRHNSGDWSISVFTSDQVAAAIEKATKPLEDEVKAANSECELFRKNGRIVDANKIVELSTQLAAAQEEIERWKNGGYTNLWKQRTEDRDETIERQRLTLLDLRNQLAKAEQRVAEACSKLCGSIAERPGHLGATDCEEAIDSSEWRKFVKEV